MSDKSHECHQGKHGCIQELTDLLAGLIWELKGRQSTNGEEACNKQHGNEAEGRHQLSEDYIG